MFDLLAECEPGQYLINLHAHMQSRIACVTSHCTSPGPPLADAHTLTITSAAASPGDLEMPLKELMARGSRHCCSHPAENEACTSCTFVLPPCKI